MFDMFWRKGPLPAVIVMLIALSAPAYPADNATVTGDGVRVREQPSVWVGIHRTFDKGERVEVVAKTDFSDTINGSTAAWYELSGADGYGYVFGQFIELDPGVAVPPLDSNEPYSDPMFSFMRHSMEMFGGTASAIIKTLGQPVSRTEEKWESHYVPDKYEYDRTLTYSGLVVKVSALEGDHEYVYWLSLTTDAYAVNGLRVGSTVADVERVLGPQTKIEGESLVYCTRYYDDMCTDIHVSFKIKDGIVVEIIFQEFTE